MPYHISPFSCLAYINEWTLAIAIFILVNQKVREDSCQLFETVSISSFTLMFNYHCFSKRK